MNREIIPVYRPRLPSAEALRPYLETVDRTRRYSNHGPLERQFAAALSRLLGSDDAIAATASSGTAALAGAILAHAGRASAPRRVCLCPAYTFVATAAAVEQCGYQLHFIDVDEVTWCTRPDSLIAHPALSEVGLVVPVATYGRAVPQDGWRRFEQQSGIPVVIDGAAALEALSDDPTSYVGPLPVSLSFHATKVFGTGEGGAVITTNPEGLTRSIQALNFGFMGARSSTTAGTNGKMSEYHAAVGLAELSGWDEKRDAYARVRAVYCDCASRHGFGERFITGPAIASCYALYHASTSAEARSVIAALSEAGVEYRHWYGFGVHCEPYFESMVRDPLPGVERLAPCVIGVPMAPDLTSVEIGRVVGAIALGRERLTA